MQEWLSSRWQHHLVTAAAQQVSAQPNMRPKAASGATLQPIAAASPDGTPSHEALLLLEATSAPCPDQIALPGPAVASAAAYESSAAVAATPSTESVGWKGRTGAIATAAAPSCNMAGSQLPDHLPDSSHQSPQGFVIIQSDENEMDAQAQQQQQQQQDATVSTSTKQSAVPGLADAPSTQDGGEVQQAALPSAHGSGNTSASLYPFPSQRSPQDRLEGILRSGPCGEDREGLYVFGRRRATLAERTAAASAGQAEGQGEGQADGQADGQAGGQPHGQSDGQSAGQAEGPPDRQPDGQSAGQVEGQADWQANGKFEGQAEGQTDGHAQGLAEGQASPSHRQEGQSGQQAVQHAVPPNFLVPCSPSPLADEETQSHPQEGVLVQSPLCSKASVPASVIAEAPAAAAQGTTMPAAASKAAAAAAASGAMSMKRMTEAVAGAAQDRLQLKMQHEELVAVALGDKPSNAAAQPAAEASSAAGPVAAVLPEPASSAAEAATPDVSMLAQSAAGAATPDESMPAKSAAGADTPDASEPARAADEEAAAEVAIPAPVPCTKAAAESLPVSPRVAAAGGINGKQSKKRKSKYFSETFDQKKRRINRVQKMKAENRAARAADAALPWTASSEGRFADSPSISEENRTPVSASLSASISNGPGILAFFKLFFCCNGWLGTLVYLFYPLFSFLSSIPLASP